MWANTTGEYKYHGSEWAESGHPVLQTLVVCVWLALTMYQLCPCGHRGRQNISQKSAESNDDTSQDGVDKDSASDADDPIDIMVIDLPGPGKRQVRAYFIHVTFHIVSSRTRIICRCKKTLTSVNIRRAQRRGYTEEFAAFSVKESFAVASPRYIWMCVFHVPCELLDTTSLSPRSALCVYMVM